MNIKFQSSALTILVLAILGTSCGFDGLAKATLVPLTATQIPNAKRTAATGRIATQSWRDGNFEIYVMNADGSEPTNVSNNPASHDGKHSWSPDGQHIAFVSGSLTSAKYDIYIVNVDGSQKRNLTNAPGVYGQPAWSPDGQRIAFAFLPGGARNYGLYVINADGSQKRNLTALSSAGDPPVWSPGGQRIAWGDFGIFVVNVDGSQRTRLASAGGNPAWSRDGQRIAFDANPNDKPEAYAMKTTGWLPRTYWAQLIPPLRVREIYVMSAEGSQKTRLTNDPGYFNGNPVWSPDGQYIAFVSNRPGSKESGLDEIYVMNADGSQQTRLTNTPRQSNTQPVWSPDGRYIAFCSTRDGKQQIYLMNADGSQQTNLTNHRAIDCDPAWSPK